MGLLGLELAEQAHHTALRDRVKRLTPVRQVFVCARLYEFVTIDIG